MGTATLPRPADDRTHLRLAFLAALLASVFVILLARLWFIQIVAGDRYAALAERGRVRTVSLEAPRGRIFDRRGRVLVDNRQVHVVGVRLEEMGDRRAAVLAELGQLLGLDEEQLGERLADADSDPLRPVPVAFDVPERIALYLWEHQSTRFPGVYAELLPRRGYPHGRLAAHVLGYSGQITAEQLAQPAYRGYEAGTQVGMAGVERSYERLLDGTPGRRRLEIDAAGDVVRQLSERLPVPGGDLRLTIDLDMQSAAERALAAGVERARGLRDPEGRNGGRYAAPAGAVVVLDPRDGAVRAAASLPTYAPEAFVGGIDADSYGALIDPAHHAPLLNRTVQAAYPPGSVFKIVSAAAALRHGFASPDTTIPCPGQWRWGDQVFRNWTSADLGAKTLSAALAQSCDTVFYALAQQMWQAETDTGRPGEFIGEEATRFGYGARLGVDLPDERDGLVPGRAWRRRVWEQQHDSDCRQAREARDAARRRLLEELCSPEGAQWRGGDAVNLAIGQGDLLATPLQVATSMVAIANGGTVWQPHVGAGTDRGGRKATIAPRELGRLALPGPALQAIRGGLMGVTTADGTAAGAFRGTAIGVAGKTGTAESGPDQPFAWFAGYGPTQHARYVVVAMVEQGGSGSSTAAPIARDIFDALTAIEQQADP